MPSSLRAAIQYLVPPLLLWVAGFFAAMLWFMLMADTLAPTAFDATRTFYTVIFGPMTWLIKIVFGLGLLCMTLQMTITALPWYVRFLVFFTNAPPIFMAALHAIPTVNRFIANTDSLAVQAELARAVYTDHLIAAACVTLMLVLQIVGLIHLQRQAKK